MSLESLCTVFLNPVIVIRESGFKPLVSMVNWTVPGVSRIQNLLLRGDMTSPLNTISPRPSANVDTSNTNGESFGACYPNVNILCCALNSFILEKLLLLTNEPSVLKLVKLFISSRKDAILPVRFLTISSVAVNRMLIFSIFSIILDS